jgi:hypothetical protein
MTTYDVVTAVLAFVRVNGPIGAVAYVMGALAATLIVFFLSAKAAARLMTPLILIPRRKYWRKP